MPRWNTISVSGYHIREAGSTALQELAFTLRDGIEYVQWGVDAGLDVDDFVPRMSFFFNAHSDFFEEIAKYRAARALWAHAMRERFGAKDERSWKLRFHSQTAGVSLTAQQPYNNVVRTALQALSAVLGGTNSLHTNSLDEALALPTAEAATLALRTQQIIAYESGVAGVVDPLGGWYFVEKLTRDMEDEARALLRPDRRDGRHGRRRSRPASRSGKSPRARTASSRRSRPGEDDCRRQRFRPGRRAPLETLYIDESTGDTAARQAGTAEDVATRRQGAVGARRAAATPRATTSNVMPPILDAVRAYATVGEMCDALRDVWGEYEEVPII